MEILTSAQMRAVDRHAIERLGISSSILMESAGVGVTNGLLRDWPDAVARGTFVLCGKGNNGGDGLVVARHLQRRNLPVEVALLAPSNELSGDAAVQLAAAQGSGVRIHEPDDGGLTADASAALEAAGLVVDAMLGTGTVGGARGAAAQAIERLRRPRAPIAAVDLPSGMDADDESFGGLCVSAAATYTLCRPKPALLARAQQPKIGRLTVVPIGIPPEAVRAAGSKREWLRPGTLRPCLPVRPAAGHKGTFGHLLVVAGNAGTAGAAILSATAALRSGVGLLTVAAPEGALSTVRAARPEWMTAEFAAWPELAAERDALAIGPGLGTEAETVRSIVEGLAQTGARSIVDADGLNAFPEGRGWRVPDDGERVVTPHPGEAARLLGCSTAEIQADRRGSALRLAERFGCVALLKGDRTWIAAPDGRTALNTTGNPGMATGGSGDVLTGLIGSFLAQGVSAWNSACLGAYLHGSAGDRVAEATGSEGLAAGDLADAIPSAVRELKWDGGAEPW